LKKLNDILNCIKSLSIQGNTAIAIDNITFDSRDKGKNMLFIALKGEKNDGHQFIEQAINNGAVAIVYETNPKKLKEGITYIKVDNSSLALAYLSSHFYNEPSKKIKLIGITGTNGKTTTATILYNMFTSMGYTCGLVSTIKIIINKRSVETTHTTPDAIKLNKIFNDMIEEGVTHCFMEVSSHAVVQNRIAGLHFSGGVFTNITLDHLDYHLTFAEYIKAKKMFFDNLPSTAFALSNSDDKNGEVMLQNTLASKHYFGLKKNAEFKAKIVESHFSGMNINICGQEVWLQLLGEFNAYNALTAYATAKLLNEDKMHILEHLSNVKPVEGRFEYFVNQNQITAIVDYAHTPDALKNILTTVNALRTRNEDLITLVGCGGNRDKTKRPLMAKIAAQLSSKLIITSDNPRFEDPELIIDEMMAGIDVVQSKKTTKITDRNQAIRTACLMAQKGDIILVAGKGHEKYQEINGVKYPFDDLELLKNYLNA